MLKVTEEGAEFIIHGERVKVDFKKCVENFKKQNAGSTHTVASRDIRRYRFYFYSEPEVEICFRGIFKDLKFNSLRKKIEKAGYHTYDIS